MENNYAVPLSFPKKLLSLQQYNQTDMDLAKHKFIILGSDHSNTLGQIRCLGEMGIRPIVIITEKHPFIINKSKYIDEYHIVDTIYDGPKYVLEHYCNEEYPPFIYTDRDDIMCAIDDYYDELKGKFIFWNAGAKGKIRQLINKEVQMNLAKECGLNVIPTEHVKRGEMPKELQYPIFTKAPNSLNPYWKANAFVCNNDIELEEAYKHMGIEEVLLQTYIKKKDEAPIQGMSINGGEEVKLYARKSSARFSPNGFGVYSIIEQYDNKEIEEKVTNLLRKACYTGIFEIEFIEDNNNTLYFLEINFRCTMSIHSYAQFGINIPYLFAKSSLEGTIVQRKTLDYAKTNFHMMIELEDLKHSVIEGNTSFWRWLKDFISADSHLYIDKHDMAPFWSLLKHKITDKLKNR